MYPAFTVGFVVVYWVCDIVVGRLIVNILVTRGRVVIVAVE